MKFASGGGHLPPSGHASLKDSNRTTCSQRYEGCVNNTEEASSSQVCENEGDMERVSTRSFWGPVSPSFFLSLA